MPPCSVIFTEARGGFFADKNGRIFPRSQGSARAGGCTPLYGPLSRRRAAAEPARADKKRAPQRTLLIASLFQPWVQPTRPTFFSSRMRSEIMAMNSEFVGLPRRLWMV